MTVWVLTVALGAMLAAIAVQDLRSLRIPDALSLPLVVSGLAGAWLGPESAAAGLADCLIGAGLGFLLFAGIGEAFYRLRGIDGLGLGDAKLFAAAGAWLGWQALPQVLLIATLGGLAQAVIQRKAAETGLAFGPWIALGFYAIWIVRAF